MSQLPTLHELIPLLPELVLACGAMAMLMLGVAIGERSAAVVNGFCFIVLLLAGAALVAVVRKGEPFAEPLVRGINGALQGLERIANG